MHHNIIAVAAIANRQAQLTRSKNAKWVVEPLTEKPITWKRLSKREEKETLLFLLIFFSTTTTKSIYFSIEIVLHRDICVCLFSFEKKYFVTSLKIAFSFVVIELFYLDMLRIFFVVVIWRSLFSFLFFAYTHTHSHMDRKKIFVMHMKRFFLYTTVYVYHTTIGKSFFFCFSFLILFLNCKEKKIFYLKLSISFEWQFNKISVIAATCFRSSFFLICLFTFYFINIIFAYFVSFLD